MPLSFLLCVVVIVLVDLLVLLLLQLLLVLVLVPLRGSFYFIYSKTSPNKDCAMSGTVKRL